MLQMIGNALSGIGRTAGGIAKGAGQVAHEFASQTSENYNRRMGFPTTFEKEMESVATLPKGSPAQISATMEAVKRHGAKRVAEFVRQMGPVTDAQGGLNPQFQSPRDIAYTDYMKSVGAHRGLSPDKQFELLQAVSDDWLGRKPGDVGPGGKIIPYPDTHPETQAWRREGQDLQSRRQQFIQQHLGAPSGQSGLPVRGTQTGGGDWSKRIRTTNLNTGQQNVNGQPTGQVEPGYNLPVRGTQTGPLAGIPVSNPALMANPTIPWLRSDAPPELVKKVQQAMGAKLSPQEIMAADDVKPYIFGMGR